VTTTLPGELDPSNLLFDLLWTIYLFKLHWQKSQNLQNMVVKHLRYGEINVWDFKTQVLKPCGRKLYIYIYSVHIKSDTWMKSRCLCLKHQMTDNENKHGHSDAPLLRRSDAYLKLLFSSLFCCHRHTCRFRHLSNRSEVFTLADRQRDLWNEEGYPCFPIKLSIRVVNWRNIEKQFKESNGTGRGGRIIFSVYSVQALLDLHVLFRQRQWLHQACL